jgi:hypothetical protein
MLAVLAASGFLAACMPARWPSLVTYPVKTATAVKIDSLDVFGAVKLE